MLHRVLLPQLGQTMEEGIIEKWHKAEGDAVSKGEVLFELTTDKATLEVEAYASGVVKRILAAEGATVPVNELIAIIGDEDDEVPENLTAPAAAGGPEAPADGKPAPEARVAAARQAAPTPPAGPVFASPRARKVAREKKVPLEALAGSGPNGRVVENDVVEYLERLAEVKYTPTAASYAFEAGVSLLDVAAAAPGKRLTRQDVEAAVESGAVRAGAPGPRAGEGRLVPLSAMRQTIAERMTASKQSTPHFYLAGEVLMRRAFEFLEEACASSGAKITVTTLLVKAIGLALKQHPRVNAQFRGDSVALNPSCNVGVAVAVEDGLFVPVIRDADGKDLAGIAAELRSLAESAREGKMRPEQYEGGSITLSNLGMYGVDVFQPIINPPESAIIGVGAIRDRVVAVEGAVCVEPTMMLSLSGDHRVLDGVGGAEFFRTVREMLEDPGGAVQ